LLLAVVPESALAHGAGGRYELGLPPSLFFLGGGAVVVVSFAAVSFVSGDEGEAFSYRRLELSSTPLGVLRSPVIVGLARAASITLLMTSVVAGLVGPHSFEENLLTNLVWVGFWIGYTFSVVLVGNTWPAINPWKACYEWGTRLLGRDPALDREYRWGQYPAAALFLVFAWLEVIAPVSESPRWMAGIVLAYSAYLWTGMIVFGPRTWLANADPFTRLFDYLGRFAPISLEDGEVRCYGVGLVDDDPILYAPGALAFLVAVLYTVTFDGFLGTPEWRELALSAPELPIPYATSTLLLLVGYVLVYEVYVTVAWVMQLVLETDATADPADAGVSDASDHEPNDEAFLARRFALSLLPIAVVYQLSHFFTYLLLQGQYLLKTLFDPFGMGWNPFGLATFEPTATIPMLPVELVWQLQVLLIVLGHILAVWVAHHIAMTCFEGRARAIKSQLPMTGVMVLYTVAGLVLLTRTVVEPPLP